MRFLKVFMALMTMNSTEAMIRKSNVACRSTPYLIRIGFDGVGILAERSVRFTPPTQIADDRREDVFNHCRNDLAERDADDDADRQIDDVALQREVLEFFSETHPIPLLTVVHNDLHL